jgi:hypothetical protein
MQLNAVRQGSNVSYSLGIRGTGVFCREVCIALDRFHGGVDCGSDANEQDRG